MIRRLVAEDAPLLRELRLMMLTDAPDAFGSTVATTLSRSMSEWEHLLRPDGNPYFVEQGGPLVVGLIGASRPDESGTSHLVSMWVPPEHRGRGVSDRLVRHVIDWTTAAGARRLVLECAEGNGFAERLYARNGFQRNGVVGVRERDGMPEFEMFLDLPRAPL